MTLSDSRRITDELLSAYIDGEITEQERAFIEAAIAQDEEIAWRLNSLRQTVTLLRDLPEVALPRSFTLTLDQVHLALHDEQLAATGAVERASAAPRPQHKAAPTTQAEFWEQVSEGWRRFWQAGNPLLRNAAAVSFALMLLLTGGGQFINRAMQPMGSLTTVSDSAPAPGPAAEEGAPAAAVALAPTATVPVAAEEVAASPAQDQDAANKVSTTEEDATGEEATGEPLEEAATQEESAALMQAPAESPAASTTESTESAVAASEAAEGEVPESQAAIAGAAPDSAAQAATAEEPAAAAAMMAPEEPPLSRGQPPYPGAGGSGGGPGLGGAEADGLLPEQAYTFDVDPMPPTGAPPANEAVSAAVAAAPAAAAPAESAADVAVTPAVDAPVAEAEAAMAAGDVARESAEESAEDTDESITESVESGAAARSVAPPAEAPAESDEEAGAVEAVVEPTAEPTPEAVALVAPEPITSSDVVEIVQADDAVPATSYGANLPVLWIAQGSALLLTVVLGSLWWRSRPPRRP